MVFYNVFVNQFCSDFIHLMDSRKEPLRFRSRVFTNVGHLDPPSGMLGSAAYLEGGALCSAPIAVAIDDARPMH